MSLYKGRDWTCKEYLDMMKEVFTLEFRLRSFKISNLFWPLLFAVVFIPRIGGWIKHWQAEGNQVAKDLTAISLDFKEVSFPEDRSRSSILIFWATWCGPCKIELDRFKKSVRSGAIDGGRIYAISLDEPTLAVKQFQEKSKYPFHILSDPKGKMRRQFHIPGTPTVFHIDKEGKIVWASSGISPTGIFRAKAHLDESS